MSLSLPDLRVLSSLLDEALALAPDQRDAWVAALAPEHAHLGGPLRRALRERDAPTGLQALSSLPTLGPGDAPARAGDRVGPYRLVREIGRGGMGSVWLAQRADGAFEREVALKLPCLASDDGLAARMALERRIGARLEHPGIARLYDAGLDSEGRPYIAMEHVVGVPIDAWVRMRRLDPRAIVRLEVQVARAVAYAHGRLVVHRDLKPGNVLVDSDGQPHLLDFGIAKLLEAAEHPLDPSSEFGAAMTPAYAAPEQFRGEPAAVQSDVYSLGVLLYELLTGRTPHDRQADLVAHGKAVQAGEPPVASSRASGKTLAGVLRGDIDAILAKALRADPGARYAGADAFADDLDRWLRGEPVAARPGNTLYRWGKALRRHWVPASAAALIVVAIVSGAGVAAVQAQRAARAAERERTVKDFIADVFRVNAQVDPAQAALRETVTRRDLLAGGSGLIERRFADQPELRADLYGMLSRVFSDMGAYRVASDYATKQVEALAALKAPRAEQADALLALGLALVDDQRIEDGELRLRRALDLARGTARLEAGAGIALATALLLRGQLDEAERALEGVEAELERLSAGPSRLRALWIARHALLLGLRNRFDEARPLWDRAIDTAIAAEGPLSPTAARLRINLGLRIVQTPADAEARRYFDPGVEALRSLGGVHEVRAAFEQARYARRRWIAGGHGTPAEALAQIAEGRRVLAATTLPLPDHFVALVDFWAAEVRLQHGDLRAALPAIDAHADLLDRAIVAPRERLDLAFALGQAYMLAGRHERAERWLRERHELRRSLNQHRGANAAGDFAVRARNWSMQGQYGKALAHLAKAPPLETMRGEAGNPDRQVRELVWTRAQVLLDSGDAAAALLVIDAAAPVEVDSARDRRRYRILRGAALCAVGRAGEGMALAAESAAPVDAAREHTDAPWRASERARLGQCALRAGDATLAKRMADSARAALDAQPEVSAYYRAPLEALERSLATRPRRGATVAAR